MANRDKGPRLRRRITVWYKTNRRELQWRTSTDPYEILVSEIMLQQTQVARVREKLPVFLKSFPDIYTLASARCADVLRAWRGMGYNNRAVHLHELARRVVAEQGGELPRDVDSLLKLPGIGRYTAHAVACFAFRRRVPVVDVNIRRVITRLYHRTPIGEPYGPIGEIRSRAEALLPKNASDWNQALMDLGATICTARSPRCRSCPVTDYCASAALLSQQYRNNGTLRKPDAAKREPSYAGIPRRIWRGRIVNALRDSGKTSMSAERVGNVIKKKFKTKDIPWLLGVLRLMARDGVVALREHGKNFYVSFPEEP